MNEAQKKVLSYLESSNQEYHNSIVIKAQCNATNDDLNELFKHGKINVNEGINNKIISLC